VGANIRSQGQVGLPSFPHSPQAFTKKEKGPKRKKSGDDDLLSPILNNGIAITYKARKLWEN
jgi:hypothetical protein